MFDLADNLCQRYPALTPFMVRREKFGEVTLLVRRLNKQSKRNGNNEKEINGIKTKTADEVIQYENGDIKIRRPATDDSWY